MCRFGQASHHESGGRETLAAQSVVLVHHLHGQFARGHQHQRGDSGCLILQQVFDDGDQEGQRFAGPGLSGGKYVLARKRFRNGGGLHGSGNGELRGGQPVLHIL